VTPGFRHALTSAVKRISDEPAYVLHRYDWSESSLILEVFTATTAGWRWWPRAPSGPVPAFARPAAAAAAAPGLWRRCRDPHAQRAPSGWAAMSCPPATRCCRVITSTSCCCACWRAMTRIRPVRCLCAGGAGAGVGTAMPLQPALRAFELLLLREIGLLPVLDAQTMTLAPLQMGALLPGARGRAARPPTPTAASLSGAQWLALQRRWTTRRRSTPPCVPVRGGGGRTQAPVARAAELPLRVSTLRTRQMMIDLQSL
jgi:DNA repair protein RecO (recombination protein O)